MSKLNPCKRCGDIPIEQVRGDMKPEDHHMQFARYHAVDDLAKKHGVILDVEEFRRDAFEVESEPDFQHDMRVSCPKCGNAIGWMRRDIEEYRNFGPGDNRLQIIKRDGNMDAIRKRWNDANLVIN